MRKIINIPVLLLSALLIFQSCSEPTAVKEDPETGILDSWVLKKTSWDRLNDDNNDDPSESTFSEIGESFILIITSDSMAYWSNLCSVGNDLVAVPDYAFKVSLSADSLISSSLIRHLNGSTESLTERYSSALDGDILVLIKVLDHGDYQDYTTLEFERFIRTSATEDWLSNFTNDDHEPDGTMDDASHFILNDSTFNMPRSGSIVLGDEDWIGFTDSLNYGSLAVEFYGNTMLKISLYDSTTGLLLNSYDAVPGSVSSIKFGLNLPTFVSSQGENLLRMIYLVDGSERIMGRSYFLKFESYNSDGMCGNYGIGIGGYDGSF